MRSTFILLAMAAVAASLSGCERADNRTRSPEGDTVVADRGPRTDAPPYHPNTFAIPVQDAADAGVDRTQDAAIGVEIHARLSRDPELGAADIEVDSVAGRVVLRGSAPDAAARERATALALGVQGVREVSNELRLGR